MKKRSFLAIILGLALCVAMAAPTFAVSTPNQAVRELAYTNIEKVSYEMRLEILAARNTIIYGDQAWTVDGAVKKHNADGTVSVLPEFTELFPDWDVPTIHTIPAIVSNVTSGTARSSISYSGNVYLTMQTSAADSPAFYNFTGLGTDVKAYAQTLPGAKYNLGFTNEDTMASVGWVPNLAVGAANGYSITAATNVRYSVRASVYNAADVGTGRMIVEDLG